MGLSRKHDSVLCIRGTRMRVATSPQTLRTRPPVGLFLLREARSNPEFSVADFWHSSFRFLVSDCEFVVSHAAVTAALLGLGQHGSHAPSSELPLAFF